MHIEPGIVAGAKMALAYATAAGAGALTLSALRGTRAGLPLRAATATALAVLFFEVLPHWPVGVSEVHFILGTTLFLVLGVAPAAFGLAAGLLLQGLFFAPSDLPMYFVNVTTLLLPLFAMAAVAKRLIAPGTAYVDLRFGQVLALSAVFQGGVIAWVVFWALWGQGVTAETLAAVGSFAGAYLVVILVEPLLDLGLLALAKARGGFGALGQPRLTAA